MAAAGRIADIDRIPSTDDPDHLASINFVPTDLITEADRRRAQAIQRRRTDRLPFAPPTDWAAAESMLHNAVHTEAVRLDVIADDDRPQLKEASVLTESLRFYDSYYHTELDWWTAHFEGSQGIPYSSLASTDDSGRVDIGRTFPTPHHQEQRTDVPTDYSKVVVLSTNGSSHVDALRCGEVLSSVLLECTMAGLATCTLTHITELQTSRHLISLLIGQDATPQVLIRVGLAPSTEDAPPATPRRPPTRCWSFVAED